MPCKMQFAGREGKSVLMSALTGRGDVARCDIEIPLEAVPELIAKLQALVRSVEVVHEAKV